MGRSHSHRPSPDKVAQRKRQAAYAAAYRAKQRQERERERAEREAAELAAIYADHAPQAAPEPRSEELLRCANCETERPASEFSPAAAARVRKGRSAWCNRCHEVRLRLLITPHGRRVA